MDYATQILKQHIKMEAAAAMKAECRTPPPPPAGLEAHVYRYLRLARTLYVQAACATRDGGMRGSPDTCPIGERCRTGSVGKSSKPSSSVLLNPVDKHSIVDHFPAAAVTLLACELFTVKLRRQTQHRRPLPRSSRRPPSVQMLHGEGFAGWEGGGCCVEVVDDGVFVDGVQEDARGRFARFFSRARLEYSTYGACAADGGGTRLWEGRADGRLRYGRVWESDVRGSRRHVAEMSFDKLGVYPVAGGRLGSEGEVCRRKNLIAYKIRI